MTELQKCTLREEWLGWNSYTAVLNAWCLHGFAAIHGDTYTLFTPWSRVLLEQLFNFQLVKQFPTFYGTQRFITTFTSARHLSLSWASSIQSLPLHSTSWRLILMLSSHLCLGLPSGLVPSGCPTKTLYMPLLSPICATCPAHPILLDYITQTVLGEECRSLTSILCGFLHWCFLNLRSEEFQIIIL